MIILPDLVIMFGFRAPLSLLGLSLIVSGLWRIERKWDEEGSAAYEKAKTNNAEADNKYHSIEEASVAGDKPSPLPSTEDDDDEDLIPISKGGLSSHSTDTILVPIKDDSTDTILVPAKDLRDAKPVPIRFLKGCFLWSASFLLAPDGSLRVYCNAWSIFCIALVPAICLMIAFPIRLATVYRIKKIKKLYGGLVLVLGMLLTLCTIMDPITDAPWYFAVTGMLFVFASYYPIRFARKMGSTWELHGAPNYNISGQNLGTLLFIFGLFLFWVGANAVDRAGQISNNIPIYLRFRTLLVFASGMFIIIPSTWALDYAFDKTPEPTDGASPELNGKALAPLAKLEPAICRGALETLARVFFLLGWVLFGACSWIPLGEYTNHKLSVCLLASSCGIITTFLVFPAYWAADFENFKHWAMAHGITMVLLSLSIGLKGKPQLIMSIIGCLLILVGNRFDMLDRRRGLWWVREQATNPNPSAFNFGHPSIVTGWILLCLAMSVPM